MLTKEHRQEALCRAYVQAVVAQAGLSYSFLANDYGIDLSLRAFKKRDQRHTDAGIPLDIQLKSTTRAEVREAHVVYDLEVKAYEDLRDPEARAPRILVMLVMPDDEGGWLSQSEEGLTLHRCAYWLSLKGYPPTAATSTVRINIPRTNVFSVPQLRALIERIQQGGEP
ncbi:MAG: DUF4365 domain-containing protein [Gemmataceae bacterium]|nr:DUF4365 domain-containing protein [Gemmataceae bacterium]